MRIIFLIFSVLAWPAVGGECFCMVDADDSIWFDCREQTRPKQTKPLVFCSDAVNGQQVELKDIQGLTKITGGHSPCAPCRLSDSSDIDNAIRDVPDDDQNQKIEPGHDKAGSGKL
jgi:hypothetical protein